MKRVFSVLGVMLVVAGVLGFTQPEAVNARAKELAVGPGQEYDTIQSAVN